MRARISRSTLSRRVRQVQATSSRRSRRPGTDARQALAIHGERVVHEADVPDAVAAPQLLDLAQDALGRARDQPAAVGPNAVRAPVRATALGHDRADRPLEVRLAVAIERNERVVREGQRVQVRKPGPICSHACLAVRAVGDPDHAREVSSFAEAVEELREGQLRLVPDHDVDAGPREDLAWELRRQVAEAHGLGAGQGHGDPVEHRHVSREGVEARHRDDEIRTNRLQLADHADLVPALGDRIDQMDGGLLPLPEDRPKRHQLERRHQEVRGVVGRDPAPHHPLRVGQVDEGGLQHAGSPRRASASPSARSFGAKPMSSRSGSMSTTVAWVNAIT